MGYVDLNLSASSAASLNNRNTFYGGSVTPTWVYIAMAIAGVIALVYFLRKIKKAT